MNYFLFNALVVQQQNYTSERIVQNSPEDMAMRARCCRRKRAM